jgi:glycosyltransferase involved in cell wall biosynthesis
MNYNSPKNTLTIAYYSLDYPNFPSPRLRVIEPCGYLNIQLLYGVAFSGNEISIRVDIIEQADLIIVQRGFPRAETQKVLDFIIESNKPVIYETDDLLTAIPDSHNKPIYNQIKDYIIEFIKKVDYVSVSTQELKNHYLEFNSNVHVLPNLIDERKWNFPIIKNTSKIITIGFYGNRGHIEDVKMIEEAILGIARKYGSRVKFVFVGCITDKLRSMKHITFIEPNFHYLNWPQRLAQLQLDIGIVPLVNTKFNRCVSAIKWFEYSALKIPVIFSDVIPYNELIIDSETGLLVNDDPDSWSKALDKLIQDKKTRKQIAKNAKDTVYSNFTLSAKAHVYREFFSDVINMHKNKH